MRVIFRILPLLLIGGSDTALAQETDSRIILPPYEHNVALSVNTALQQRRSAREYKPDKLLLTDISQILWSAQGVTHPDGYRTTPSAGALYPLEIYLLAGDIENLPTGVYRYEPEKHELVLIQNDDQRQQLTSAALNQAYISQAPAVIIIAGVYQRTTWKYGQRGRRYVHIEVGHAAQNIYLQAEVRGLATVFVGAFDDAKVQHVLGLPSDHEPIGIMPIGKKR
ncbi:MAG: SagB/ThcOx family dehydrogenase [Gammaproteobacteria bacterium]|nr:MAG: SagB/ThcOx family dehydrogenase [Gammaproteobacteria bacterium]